jgi:hypothetical protein
MLRLTIALALLIIAGHRSMAQSETPISDTDASKESENPVTRWITLPLRYEAGFLDGPYKATKDTFEIDQAVVPFSLNDDWALITRTKLPAVVQPPNPSATNSDIGVNKWGSGPSVAFVFRNDGPWVFGAVTNNIWSFGGPAPDSDRTNQFLLNPFVSYHFDDGWSVGSSPNIAANWIANGGKWTVPVGGGISKTVRIGDQPLKFAVDSYYNAIRPKAGFDTWILQVTIIVLFDN